MFAGKITIPVAGKIKSRFILQSYTSLFTGNFNDDSILWASEGTLTTLDVKQI